MSLKPAMPETNLYIWYHADIKLEPELLFWIELVHDELGYRGSLLRRDTDDKSTFMEIYENVDVAAADRIEELASNQLWFSRLHSPRRCESFRIIVEATSS